LALLEEVELHIAQMESNLCALLSETPYHIWSQIKGLSDVQVVDLAAAIGDPQNYKHAKQVFRRSGLVSGRNDSGTRQRKGKGSKVVKVGDVYLRRALINAVVTLILHQPILWAYYSKLKAFKHSGVAKVATARRALGILWAIQRDQRSDSLILKKESLM
jgi:transposase